MANRKTFGETMRRNVVTFGIGAAGTGKTFLAVALASYWVKLVCERLESRYRYSATIYYNPFPWPLFYTESQRRRIEQTAQKILDVRKNYPDATLADLYDELTMPADLRQAHRDNDRAVAVAYGFENLLNDESAIVAELVKLYTGSD